MARIIFNADDLGLSRGVNLGIVECYKNGVLNSCSLMTTTKYFNETVELINEHQLTNIGLHFNLTEGKPLLNTHQTIVDAKGDFMRDICDRENIDLKEVALELTAQYTKAANAGVSIVHLDSHHHVHMSDLLNKVFLQTAQKYNTPLRKVENTYRHPLRRFKHFLRFINHRFYTKSFSAEFYDEHATLEKLKDIIGCAKGTIEIMCHPGYQDEENGIYNEQRFQEMQILLNKNLKKLTN